MLIYLLLIIPVFGILFIILQIFVAHLQQGYSIYIKNFNNSDIFEYDFKNLKFKSDSLYNMQSLRLIFDDNSKVHVFGGLEDKSIIPLMSDFLNVDENDIKAGSMHKKLELNAFVKNFETHYINVEILDKNNNLVEHFISKGFNQEDNKQFISISLKNNKWKNISNIKFKSTTKIDVELFYICYGY